MAKLITWSCRALTVDIRTCLGFVIRPVIGWVLSLFCQTKVLPWAMATSETAPWFCAPHCRPLDHDLISRSAVRGISSCPLTRPISSIPGAPLLSRFEFFNCQKASELHGIWMHLTDQSLWPLDCSFFVNCWSIGSIEVAALETNTWWTHLARLQGGSHSC